MHTTLSIPIDISFLLTLDLEQGTLHELQRDMRREARRTLLAALRAGIARIEKALLAAPVLCPSCAKPMRSKGRTVRRIVTVFGSLELARAGYRCARCRTIRRPLDEWIGVLAGTEY